VGQHGRLYSDELKAMHAMLACRAPSLCLHGRLTGSASCYKLPMQAVTLSCQYIAQAWRAVDKAYVDKSFNGNTWFRVKEQFLKNERMTDRHETYAAIRKMLALLDDPFTRFLEPERYSVLKRGSSGSVTGVGLEIAFSQDLSTAGRLQVRHLSAHCQ
jgi:C-terminal processing protease CtpA/Prc